MAPPPAAKGNRSVPTWTHPQNSLTAVEALSLKISSHGTSQQMITKTIPVSTRLVISCAMKRDIPLWIWWKVNGNWENNMIRIFQWRKTIVEQILASEEINKFKRARLWESVWDPSRKVSHLSKVVWDRKTIAEFTRSNSSTRIS